MSSVVLFGVKVLRSYGGGDKESRKNLASNKKTNYQSSTFISVKSFARQNAQSEHGRDKDQSFIFYLFDKESLVRRKGVGDKL